MRPPWHPWFFFEQSTSYCSDIDWSSPPATFLTPSMAPVDEKAQHDPHPP